MHDGVGAWRPLNDSWLRCGRPCSRQHGALGQRRARPGPGWGLRAQLTARATTRYPSNRPTITSSVFTGLSSRMLTTAPGIFRSASQLTAETLASPRGIPRNWRPGPVCGRSPTCRVAQCGLRCHTDREAVSSGSAHGSDKRPCVHSAEFGPLEFGAVVDLALGGAMIHPFDP